MGKTGEGNLRKQSPEVFLDLCSGKPQPSRAEDTVPVPWAACTGREGNVWLKGTYNDHVAQLPDHLRANPNGKERTLKRIPDGRGRGSPKVRTTWSWWEITGKSWEYLGKDVHADPFFPSSAHRTPALPWEGVTQVWEPWDGTWH